MQFEKKNVLLEWYISLKYAFPVHGKSIYGQVMSDSFHYTYLKTRQNIVCLLETFIYCTGTEVRSTFTRLCNR